MGFERSMEEALLEFVNSDACKYKTKIKKFQRINLYIYNMDVLKSILKVCKFKDAGNVYDHMKDLPHPDYINGSDLMADYELFHRIAVSNNMRAIAYYTVTDYSINCTFLVSIKRLKRFFNKTRDILRHKSGTDEFRDVDFNCKPMEYIEILEEPEDKTRRYTVLKQKVVKEHLVFDKKSTLTDVMGDIKSFFSKETEELYTKLNLAYKRGLILHGPPGNGKSAMIRELIRSVPDITKIVINATSDGVTRMLKSLTKSLNGRRVVIIMEDLDSLITDYNRSEFLNILDGIDAKTGLLFIGTTNYPERIDPSFMDRGGRFDRKYEIGCPNVDMRKLFFEDKKIASIFTGYPLSNTPSDKSFEEGVVDIFVRCSRELPIASLKELITSTAYLLAKTPNLTVEDAVRSAYRSIKHELDAHADSHNGYNSSRYDDYSMSPFGYMGSRRRKKYAPVEVVKDSKSIVIRSDNELSYFTREYYESHL